MYLKLLMKDQQEWYSFFKNHLKNNLYSPRDSNKFAILETQLVNIL